MVEFALVAPIFFFLLFGVVEFGLMMFDLTSTRFAAGEGARVEAQVGTLSSPCSSIVGCPELYGPTYSLLNGGVACDPACQLITPPPCQADCQTLVSLHLGVLGGNRLETVNFVEIQKMQVQGNPAVLVTPPTGVPGACLRYNFDGTKYAGPKGNPCTGYDPVAYPRNVIAGEMDYVQVDINFTYTWLTGMFAKIAASPNFDSTYLVRLEPQKFSVGP